MNKLNYKEFGQGEPIIILHGLFGTLDNWQTIAKRLAQDYYVFILDQRNHGRSPHLDTFDYSAMATDLYDFMTQQGMHQAHIIGHSMGGKTAMQFALEYPEMVDKLVVVDIAPQKYTGGHQTIFEALLSLDFDTIKTRKDADAHLEQYISDVGVRQFLLKNLSRNKATGGFRWKMNLPVIHQNYQAILDTIDGSYAFEEPCLFIRGGQSNYIQDDDKATIAKCFPNFTLETVENAGHWVHAEQPAALLRLVDDFLKSA